MSDDLNDLGELLSDPDITDLLGEVPGVGRIQRLSKILQRMMSRKYIEEIKRLKKKEDTLMKIVRDQIDLMERLRQEIKKLELQAEAKKPPDS